MAARAEEVGPAVRVTSGDAASHARRLGLSLTLAGWIGLGLMWATGSAEVFGHDQHGMPAAAAVGLFLIGWLVMVAAMMLPSSLPTLQRVGSFLQSQRGSRGFLGGYFSAWAVFGAAAFAADGVLHRVVEASSWLSARPSLILGGIAIFAGAAEMMGRTPPPLMPSGASVSGPFSLGQNHAIDRIKRCWPVMLFAMAVGMSSVTWMIGLTCVMGLELSPRAHWMLRLIGAGLVAMGLTVILEPTWMPALLGA